MKTEFNVERVCERVQLCVVDAPDDLGPANIEVRGGSIYVSFSAPLEQQATGGPETVPVGPFVAGEIAKLTGKRKGR